MFAKTINSGLMAGNGDEPPIKKDAPDDVDPEKSTGVSK